MADATDYTKTEFLNWMFNGESFDAPPSNVYIALHTGDPGSDASQNEVNAGGYSRYNSSVPGDWNIPSVGNFENVNDFIFSEATEDWGTISHFSLWDGPDATDNSFAEDALLENIVVDTGDQPVFRAGNLSGTFE